MSQKCQCGCCDTQEVLEPQPRPELEDDESATDRRLEKVDRRLERLGRRLERLRSVG